MHSYAILGCMPFVALEARPPLDVASWKDIVLLANGPLIAGSGMIRRNFVAFVRSLFEISPSSTPLPSFPFLSVPKCTMHLTNESQLVALAIYPDRSWKERLYLNPLPTMMLIYYIQSRWTELTKDFEPPPGRDEAGGLYVIGILQGFNSEFTRPIVWKWQ